MKNNKVMIKFFIILVLVIALFLFVACAEQPQQAVEYEHLGISVPLTAANLSKLSFTLPEDLPDNVVIALYENNDEAAIHLPLLEIERMSLKDYYWRSRPGVDYYADTAWWAFAQDQDWVYIYKVPVEQIEKDSYDQELAPLIYALLEGIIDDNGLFPSNNKMAEATLLYSGFALDERTALSVESVGWMSESIVEAEDNIDTDPGYGCEILLHTFSMPGGFDEQKSEGLALSDAQIESLMVRSVALYQAAYFDFAPLLSALTLEPVDLEALTAAVQATGSQWPQGLEYPALSKEATGGYTVTLMAGQQVVIFNFVLTEDQNLLCDWFSVN
ncbi:MAG: hypothetical protein PHN35_00795 [Clostridia bacterium]|nr:hypothetical protein [Clostridia bacterium]